MGPRVLGNSPSNVESIARTPIRLLARSTKACYLFPSLFLLPSRSSFHSLPPSFIPALRAQSHPTAPSPTSYLPTLSLGFRDARRYCKIPKSKEGCTLPTALPSPVSLPSRYPSLLHPAHVPSATNGNEGLARGATFLPKCRRLSVLS